MAHETTKIALLVVIATVLLASVAAQSSDCTNVIISMSPCLNYITGNSSAPSSGCCTQLATVVRSQPECLCQVLNGGGSSLGLNVNQTQALALPNVCKVQTPSISRCNGGTPAGSPTGSPDTPTTDPTGPGSNIVPPTDSGSSDAASTKLAGSLAFFLVFIASYTCTSTLF